MSNDNGGASGPRLQEINFNPADLINLMLLFQRIPDGAKDQALKTFSAKEQNTLLISNNNLVALCEILRSGSVVATQVKTKSGLILP